MNSSKVFKVAILAGDGIGPEVMESALAVLRLTGSRRGISWEFSEAAIGGAAYDRYGSHFPAETAEVCDNSDAILFGSVGGPVSELHLPKWKDCERNTILSLRQRYSFYGNFRPAKVFPGLACCSPLRLKANEPDLVIVRELLGDCYFGDHTIAIEGEERVATDTAVYRESAIKDIAHLAFQVARKRRQRVVSVDKANVLATSRLWREVTEIVAEDYPDVTLTHMLVDNCAMQLIKDPAAFDVLLAPNLFGDILSDAAAVIPGSLGLMPSASFSHSGLNLYEPSGGSAPDIAGRNIANPVAQILSGALMLRYSFKCSDEAMIIEKAVERTLSEGIVTADLSEAGTPVSTTEFTRRVLMHIDENLSG